MIVEVPVAAPGLHLSTWRRRLLVLSSCRTLVTTTEGLLTVTLVKCNIDSNNYHTFCIQKDIGPCHRLVESAEAT